MKGAVEGFIIPSVLFAERQFIRMKLIVPTIRKDINKIINHSIYFYKFLPIDEIVVVGNETIKDLVKKIGFGFINESELVSYEQISDYIVQRTGNSNDVTRTGWYLQQFIKMAYSLICDEEYYLLWDSDTVPLKVYSCFKNGQPIFDCKTEHHTAYFKTISSLFPDFDLTFKKSFISEHMLIKTSCMRNLIKEIENNSNIIWGGVNFQQKIINSINIEDLPTSGFSEFETYGNYIRNRYNGLYMVRDWKSLRFGAFFFDMTEKMDDRIVKWMSRYYDAISFEKGDKYSPTSGRILKTIYRWKLNPRILEIIAIINRLKRAFGRKLGRL